MSTNVYGDGISPNSYEKREEKFSWKFMAFLCLGLSTVTGRGQSPRRPTSPAGWTTTTASDPLTDQQYAVFELAGKFLEAPSNGSAQTPKIVLRCDPKPFRRLTGKFLAGFISVGAVVDLMNGNNSTVQFRLDDGKSQFLFGAGNTTDYQAISFDMLFLSNILWGHELPHKPGTGAPVQKLVVAVQEHLSGRIVMQFDMPDPDVVSKGCGAEYK